jgi:hypothetical protein
VFIFREVNEDNVLFRNVLVEFEESFKYVSLKKIFRLKNRAGVDVMVLKIFFAKKCAKNRRFLPEILLLFAKI